MTQAVHPPQSFALCLDKPVGFTSSDCVQKIKHALSRAGIINRATRVGHGGTLDPFATGVLVLLFGQATKLADVYLHSKKSYSGIIKLGACTDTGDLTGAITQVDSEFTKHESVTDATLQTHAQTFVNQPYLQIPPMYSAKKKDGVALHKLARAGKEIEREAILKSITRFQLRATQSDEIRFEVDCESGTYVRVLAIDFAKRLNTLAHLTALRRTASSDFSIKQAATLDAVLAALAPAVFATDHKVGPLLLTQLPGYVPFQKIGTHIPHLQVSHDDAKKVRGGLKDTIHALCLQADQTQLPAVTNEVRQYVRLCNGSDLVALLTRTQDQPQFILQRGFNQE